MGSTALLGAVWARLRSAQAFGRKLWALVAS